MACRRPGTVPYACARPNRERPSNKAELTIRADYSRVNAECAVRTVFGNIAYALAITASTMSVLEAVTGRRQRLHGCT